MRAAAGHGLVVPARPDRSGPNEQDCRLARAWRDKRSAAPDDAPRRALTPGHRTLAETERAVAERLDGSVLDMPAMAAVQNLYRAAGAHPEPPRALRARRRTA